MNKAVNYAVCGLMAAGLMIVAKLGLMHLSLPHYPGFYLSGQEGLKELGISLAYGALFGLLWGLVVRGILPSGIFMAALVFSLLPFLVDVLALPLWRGGSVDTEPWYILYNELHFYIYSLGLLFFGRQSGGKG
jgi:hypothetical protein